MLIIGIFLIGAQASPAQERLCDTAFEDCRDPLWRLIDAETVQIDVAFWFMQDTSYVTKLINRHNAGVRVRVIVDPRANPTYPGNEQVLNQLRDAGIPMRYKVGGGIQHMKMMLFAGQNRLEFSGANFSPDFFVPQQPFVNYIDEAIYFTDDLALINSFKTKYDDLWVDTTNYADYANITGPLTRSYPTFPIDPALNFPPGESFLTRTEQHLNQETQKIDIIMYRITNQFYTNATIAARGRGIPVRLLHEQNEYRNRDRQWDAWNVDRLYVAGVQIKMRKHMGLNHQKSVILYGQGMTIFGSSNWTGPSSNSQQENNYFSTKPWFFQWFVDQFERKWNSTAEFEPFVPLPPDPPASPFPADNATGQPTSLTLRWEGGPWSHKYDIYFGTDPNPPLIASDRFIGSIDNGVIETFQVTGLTEGTTYYWRIVGKTMADKTASGPVWKFTTSGVAPPPSSPPTVTAVTPNSGSANGGTPVTITGTNFAAGASVTFGGASALNVAVNSSTSISAVTPAHAEGAVDIVVTNTNGLSGMLAGGYTYTPAAPPPSGSDIVLYASEAPVKAGGWTVVADATAAGGARLHLPDAGAPKVNTPLAGPTKYFEITFNAEAGRAYRLWIRGKAQNDSWSNDSVYAQFSGSVDTGGSPVFRIGTTSGTTINLEDCSGCGLQGWGWQDNGWGTGVLGPLIYFQSTGSQTIRIQDREDGLSIDQILLSPDTYLNSAPGSLRNDGTILPKSGGSPPSAPTVASVSPSSGTTAGGTSVTISGTGFATGAMVTFGGVSAANITVLNSTTITASTPAHAAGAVDVVVTNTNGLSGTLTGGYTYTTAAPPPPPASDIVLYASEAPTRAGAWAVITDATAAGGARIHMPDAGAPKIGTPLVSPVHYFEMTFNAEAGRAYRLWIRGKAQNDFWGNDSVHVQFSGSVTASGNPVYRIGTTSGTEINLEDCSGCGLSGWGWQDNGWGAGVLGPLIYFQTSGTQTIRIQAREDGLSIDQIVLSTQNYLNNAPGALRNDSTILPKS